MTTATDRLSGLTTSVAIKPPCKAVAIANITLSGEQTVNGVACVDGDRVLVTAQTSGVDNGIYVCAVSAWARAKDFDGARDVVTGTLVLTEPGTGTAQQWEVTTSGAITIGTTSITFVQHTPEELALRADLASTASTALGDALVGVKRTFTGAVATTEHAVNEARSINLVSDCGADKTGAVAADAAMSIAIAALGTSGGVIEVPPGLYTFASPIDLGQKSCITIRGESSLTGGAAKGSKLQYTGTSGSRFVDMRSTLGCWIENCQIIHSSGSFTGYLVDFAHVIAQDSALGGLRGCTICGPISTYSAKGVNLNEAIEIDILNCNFIYLVRSIYGQDSAGGSYSNVIRIQNCQFLSTTSTPIIYGGEGWMLIGNAFEPLSNGVGGAFICTSLTPIRGMVVSGNWAGDVTTTGGVWFTLYGDGATFTGNRIGGGVGSTQGISLNTFSGFSSFGNTFNTLSVAYQFDTATCTSFIEQGNYYTAVTAKFGSATNCNSFLHTTTGYLELGNQVLEQWGKDTVTTGTPLAITFQRAYTTVFQIVLTLSNPSGTGNTVYDSALSTTGATLNVAGTAGGSSVRWRVIGLI